jgi:hypothetical protein
LENLIKRWIKKKLLYPFSIILIIIGFIFKCASIQSFYASYLVSIGIMIFIIQIIHQLVDLEKINNKYPLFYLLFYFLFITIFAIYLPVFVKNYLYLLCK